MRSSSRSTRNFSNNWGLLASYRYAKLKGNFEGFLPVGQRPVRSPISSLFDFPTNDPSYTQIGVPQFGFGGDIRFQARPWARASCRTTVRIRSRSTAPSARGTLNLGAGFNWARAAA